MLPELNQKSPFSNLKNTFSRLRNHLVLGKAPDLNLKIFIIISSLIILAVLGGILILSQTYNTANNEPLAGESPLPGQNNLTQVPTTLPDSSPAASSIRPGSTTTPRPTVAPTPKLSPTPSPTQTQASNPTPAPTTNLNTNVVELRMEPSSSNTSVNQSFTVSLILDTKTDTVSAADLHITFDKDKLQAQSITAGTYLPFVLFDGTFDNSNGTARIALGSFPGVNGTGTLATMTFKALTQGSTSPSYASNTQTTTKTQQGNSLKTSSGVTIAIGP